MSDQHGVLVLGFGGVTDTCCKRKADCPGRVECFVSKVLDDDPRQAARVAEVAAHYHALGGVSPYNPLTFAQAEALEAELARRGRPMPVRCGFRNWAPWYADGLRALHEAGCSHYRAVVMSVQQTRRSWEDYLDQCAEAAQDLGDAAPRRAGVIEPYFAGAGFVAACAAEIKVATVGWDEQRYDQATLLLTAHAIPVLAERSSPYRAQVEHSAGLIAAAAEHPAHEVGYQSAPDPSRIPWSTPTVSEQIRAAAAAGARDIIVQAVGFLVDHVEVAYDLDIEARALCAELGCGYTRARCVHDHPAFISELADRVLALD
ncbi:MAG: ferrochelatase [Planctomycetota bacterium]|jgi:ferrochelatase|nr:ferrochelatase [Planctomycetota bacterium]